MKIKKYQLIAILNVAKKYGLNTIDELVEDINKACKNDYDIVADFNIKQEKEKNKEIDLHYVPYEQYVTELNEVNEKWKDKIKEFYKKYLSESMKNFSPYVKDESTPEKERKAGTIRLLNKMRKELLED